ncbi:hypothetical protein D9M69_652290 [compost metagenome]
MFLQHALHGIAANPVEVAQFGQMAAITLGAEPLQRLPLADAIGVQIRRLLEAQQIGE